jgi:alpha-tubulin suppressor-like RCC1 family protein
MALTSGSTVLAWGLNTLGQLGINSGTSSQFSPTEVTVSGSSSVPLSGVTAIAAGGNSSAALKSGGSVWMWGDNSMGQCCQASGSSYSGAIEVTNTNISNIIAIASGTNHVLALRNDGTVWGWGSNANGQLGQRSTSSPAQGTPVKVLTSSGTLTGVVAIAAGESYSIAVKGDGTVWAWGNLGGSLIPNVTSATQISGVSGALKAAASLHVLIGGSNGSVTALGVNTNGELGIGTSTSSTTPLLSTAVLTPQPPEPTFSPDGGIYAGPQQVVISCTDSTATIYYTTDGSAPGPGNGLIIASGQSVSIGAANLLRARAVAGNTSSQIKSAAYHMGYQMLAGGQHSVLLNTDGTVYTWGSNGSDQLGLGWNSDQALPQLVASLSGSVTAIAAGEFNTAAILNSGTNIGTVWVWGGAAATGGNSTATISTPTQVSGITGAVAVALGWYHTVILTGSGTVKTLGYGGFGELGTGNEGTYSTPQAVSLPSGVKAIAAGQYHTLALLNNGTVYAWGYNNAGQSGNNSTTEDDSPVQVSGLNNIVAIAAANCSSFALRNDGTVWAWGDDGGVTTFGVPGGGDLLADDLDNYEVVPVLVGTMRDVVGVAAGSYHGVALRGDGTILTWGQNDNDAVSSSGTTGQLMLPVPVPSFSLTDGTTSLASVTTMVSAGDYHSLAVLNTTGVQTLWAWGSNLNGELGDGTFTSRYTPEMVQFSEYAYSSYDGMPDWLALTLGLDPFVPLTTDDGIPPAIQVADGLGLNPSLPYTPYTPPSGGANSPPVINVTIPAGATLY